MISIFFLKLKMVMNRVSIFIYYKQDFMGIRSLNKYLQRHCMHALENISMSSLSGKTIAVDTSIYLYKFAGEGRLIENIVSMVNIFQQYSIVPIFIFDGKPPAEKNEVLIQRRADKKEAEEEYTALQKNMRDDERKKEDICLAMEILKRKFIRIDKGKIDKVKEIFTSMGVAYCDAPGEADELCAWLTVEKKVWACLSEDMDMFVYGCPRVLRYANFTDHTFVLYTMRTILQELSMTQKEFRQVCILSGTDYNVNKEPRDLYNNMALFKTYKYSRQKIDFYTWIRDKYSTYDMNMLQTIYEMFDLSNRSLMEST